MWPLGQNPNARSRSWAHTDRLTGKTWTRPRGRCHIKLTWIFPDSAGTDPRPIRGHTHRSRRCTSLKNSFYRRIWTPPCAAPDEASLTLPGMFPRRPGCCVWATWSKCIDVSHQHHPWWTRCLFERLQSRMGKVSVDAVRWSAAYLWRLWRRRRKTVIRRRQNMLRGSAKRLNFDRNSSVLKPCKRASNRTHPFWATQTQPIKPRQVRFR